MVKKLPILRRLEVALAETDSMTEIDEVYGLLGRYCSELKCKKVTFDSFYEGMNHRTLSVIQNRRVVSLNDIERGKDIANYLNNTVSLPPKGEKGYRLKMLKVMEIEFKAFSEVYC